LAQQIYGISFKIAGRQVGFPSQEYEDGMFHQHC